MISHNDMWKMTILSYTSTSLIDEAWNRLLARNSMTATARTTENYNIIVDYWNEIEEPVVVTWYNF